MIYLWHGSTTWNLGICPPLKGVLSLQLHMHTPSFPIFFLVSGAKEGKVPLLSNTVATSFTVFHQTSRYSYLS